VIRVASEPHVFELPGCKDRHCVTEQTIELVLPTAFGLEAVVVRELRDLGYEETRVDNGRVTVCADLPAVCRLNLRLRSAERVLLKVGEFNAADFGELFDRTTALSWGRWLPVDARFPVRGKSVRSQLSHVPSCQSIIKKAIVENLSRAYGRSEFGETGGLFQVDFSLLNNRVTLSLDSSGAGLHKRGYRTWIGPAPLKETLAAGLVQLSFWNPDRPFLDPFCGTGTIAIEAALIGRNIAPGLHREFAAEQWPAIDGRFWQQARKEALDLARPPLKTPLAASDVDESSLRAAGKHAAQAGVETDIHFEQLPVAEVSSRRKFGCVVCNPPYGERSGDLPEAEAVYDDMRRAFRRLQDWSFFVLTAHKGFENLFGRQADRKRKLYNGRIECTYYQYHGPRPPWQRGDAKSV
jgi:putative N6-adenine-specific DNA methylase